jgi:hypothetical protein
MSETQNEVWVLIHKGINEGVFKNCVHLQVAGGTYSPYRPYCEKDSLIPLNSNQFQDVCPQKCYLFVDKKAVERALKKSKRRESRRAFWRPLRVAFNWFAKLSATQALIVLVIVLVPLFYVSPRVAKSIGELIKALKCGS